MDFLTDEIDSSPVQQGDGIMPKDPVWIRIEGTYDGVPDIGMGMELVHLKHQATPLTARSAEQVIRWTTLSFSDYVWSEVPAPETGRVLVQGMIKNQEFDSVSFGARLRDDAVR
jgi:hypothetical protein